MVNSRNNVCFFRAGSLKLSFSLCLCLCFYLFIGQLNDFIILQFGQSLLLSYSQLQIFHKEDEAMKKMICFIERGMRQRQFLRGPEEPSVYTRRVSPAEVFHPARDHFTRFV